MAVARAQRLTQAQMVLLAMYDASRGSTQRVPYEELVLQAWRSFPEAFSLRNYPQYPDASDIHKALYGGNLRAHGLILSLGSKVFRLTDKGLLEASRLQRAVDHAALQLPILPARLSREKRSFVDHALKSRAFQTWRDGAAERLVDYDARVFFQFSIGTSPKERRRKVDFAQEAIADARSLGLPESQELAGLAEYLIHAFRSLLDDQRPGNSTGPGE